MKVAQLPGCHLTYCTNIHPGENWQQVWSHFQKYLPAVKHSVSPDRDFGVGARLSAQAATELLQGNSLSIFKKWLADSGLYIFTLNGFPYGQFHQKKVKEKVYLPDWSEPARLEYTKELAVVLAELLPTGCNGTISTVPVGLKAVFLNHSKLVHAADNLLCLTAFLVKLYWETGQKIQLALEPEPGCYMETSDDIVSFFYDFLLTDNAMDRMKTWMPNSFQPSPELLLRHIGICLDTCHTAVMYETPEKVVKVLTDNGIAIYKIQLTAALAIEDVDHDSLTSLQQFSDPVYLHQTSITDVNGDKTFFLDLPDALERVSPGADLRVHYHVPVFEQKFDMLSSTQKDLKAFLHYFSQNPFCQHLEVETYTFDVLPKKYRHRSVEESITQELLWILDTLSNET